MKVISRSQALNLLKQNPHLTKIKLDGGKLDPKQRTQIKGRDYPCGNHIKAIWIENRKDTDGPYLILYCLADYSNNSQIVKV